MKNRQIFIRWFSLVMILVFWVPEGQAAWHDAGIVYQQAVTKILGRGDITWGSKADDYYNFGSVFASADGSKVLFTGKCEFCDPAEVRPFLVNPDGSGFKDLSGMLPADITNRWSGWRNLLINDDASKVFFRSTVETGYYDDEYLFVYDVASGTTGHAVNQKFSAFPSTWHFRIDESGNMVYLDKYDDGWDEELQRHKKGLFSAPTGGTKQWYLDVDDLPCQSQCGNLNLLSLMGISARNDRAFFKWNSDYDHTDGKKQHAGLYYTGLNGNATLLSDEHYWIGDGDERGISDAEGTTVIYQFRHKYGDPEKLAVVDVASKESREVGWASGLEGFSAHLSRSGRFVLANGKYGDDGTYYNTLLDLKSGTSRDTWSYYMMREGHTSNMTEDDRYYFYTLDGWPNSEDVVGLYRIDTLTTGDDKAPYVHSIEFSAPALLDQEDTTISVQVTISDHQGTNNIEWVRLLPLVEGQEDPSWQMGREPLAFPSGDPGSTLLYDDGTHGDLVAGDGVYTFDSIATRKGGRQEGGWNTWYQHYPLPADVGIRVVVKDQDNNYTIADTTLRITDDPQEIGPPVSGEANPATPLTPVAFGTSVNPGAVPVTVAEGTVSIKPQLAIADCNDVAMAIAYIFVPSANFGLAMPAVKSCDAGVLTVNIGTVDLTGYPGVYDIYYGYLDVIGDIHYNAYELTVQ